MAAALDIWGEHGWAAVTMRGVCARAGLTNRYFYESFPHRDALLAEVWDDALGQVVAVVVDAASTAPTEVPAQVRAVVAAFVRAVVDDPRKARVGFGDHAGSVILEQRRRAAIHTFTTLTVNVGSALDLIDRRDPSAQVTARFVVGGLAELITGWLDQELAISDDELIDHATAVVLSASSSLLHRPS
jgi:AcrR family transcriptional regulator